MTRPSAGIRILAILPIMLVLFTARLYGTPQDVGPCVIDGIDVTNAPDILAIEDDMMADMDGHRYVTRTRPGRVGPDRQHAQAASRLCSGFMSRR